jgi:hypothetical protein
MRSDRANKNSNAYRDETQDELDFLDGATAGSVVNSKAVIYSSNGLISATKIISTYPLIPYKVENIADASNDTTITSLEAGKVYFWGTATGAKSGSDGDSAMTFKLPAPTKAGERIKIYFTNAAVINKLLGVVTTTPSSQAITYYAQAQNVFLESATTATGTNGTENTMVKVAVSSVIYGDWWEFISMGSSLWRMNMFDTTDILAASDIAVDPGHSSGYID